MLRLNDIVDKVRAYLDLSEEDLELLQTAYVYSAKVHSGQKRSSGEVYLSHPLEVAGILSGMKLGIPTIITGLLHDTVEDTLATLDEIEGMFGHEIAFLVDGVTKISQLPVSSNVAKQAENFRKLILATAKDIRVVLVKLADRLHNMRTLEFLGEDQRERISQETLDIYAPLAHRLGIYWMRTELEDLSFKFLYPEEYQKLSEQFSAKRKEWKKHVKEVIALLADKLKEFGVEAEITGRFKHFYGIYSKMKDQNLDLNQLHDVIAFRIVTDSLSDCYSVLGAVHSTWKPVPGRFKDYIALPKSNGYQSLHTCILGPFGERMEIQIRTRRMHEIAEYGIAAHWKYKEGSDEEGDDTYKIFANLRKLLEWKDIKNPAEFLEAIKGELLPNSMVYVFTPGGDLKELPQNATPIDFAYSVHTDVGNRCSRAKVNGKIKPLDYKLRSGDIVEIETSGDQHPNRDWLKLVVSSKARTRIRSWLRSEERKQSLVAGRSILERKFKVHGLNLNKLLKQGEMDVVLSEHKFKDFDELFSSVGFGTISAKGVLKHFVSKEMLEPKTEKESRIGKIIQSFTDPSKSGVLVKGYDDILIRLCKRCSPIPGEQIAGYITRGRGITVHKTDCSDFLDVDPHRSIDVEWDIGTKSQRPVRISVFCDDNPGVLSGISNSISQSAVNIAKIEFHPTDDARSIGTLDIAVANLDQLEGVMKAIKKVKGVISVERIGR